MSFWSFTPRSVRIFLLGQPLTDETHAAIRASFRQDTAHAGENPAEELGLQWRHSYNLILAFLVIVISAFIVYKIVN